MTNFISKDPIQVVRASLLRHIISELKDLRDMRDEDAYVGAIENSIGRLTVALLDYEDAEKEAKKNLPKDVSKVSSEKVINTLFGRW